MRLAFMGTPDFAVPTLRTLFDAGHDIVAVYTQPPRPAGRGKKPQASPVQALAEKLGLEVRTPESLKDPSAQQQFAALELDIAVVAAYGLILPQAILDAPRQGCLNVHGSLLPRWRGAAPVQRAILAGDTTSGVTIMQMEAGLDTGPMLAKLETPVNGKTAGRLTEEIAELGAELMADVLDDLDGYPPETQPEDGVTYAKKIDKAEARLDFSSDAVSVERQVRAFNPWPGAFFELEGERYRVHAAEVIKLDRHPRRSGNTASESDEDQQDPRLREGDDRGFDAGTTIDDRLTIACAADAIRPTVIQRAGKPQMAIDDFLRGRSIPAGTRLA